VLSSPSYGNVAHDLQLRGLSITVDEGVTMKSLFLLVLCLTLFVPTVSAKDRQAEIDETIAELNEEIEELAADLPGLRREVDELVEHSRAQLRELRSDDDASTSEIEFHNRMVSLLEGHRQSGLSLTDMPGMAIYEELKSWMDSEDMTIGWGYGGLTQVSTLAGIYYVQKRISNREMLISILQSRREYGMSEAEYEWYKREWKLLGEEEAGIRPYNHATEADGLSARGLWAYPLYNLVGVWEETEMPPTGTRDFKMLQERYLRCLDRKGIDSSELVEYQQRLSRRIRRLEPGSELPDFLESVGFEEERDAEEIADITEWRANLLRASYRNWLRLLSSCDGDTIAEGLREQAEAIGKFDQATALAAEATAGQIQATQQLTEEVLGSIPLVEDALNLQAVITGETLSGEEVDGWNRLIEGALTLGPVGIKGLSKVSPSFERAVRSLHVVGKRNGRRATAYLADQFGISRSRLDQVVEAIAAALN
jgi:hypothetical protein